MSAEYQLYCFAQSGNAYRVALMLNLIGADWEPIFVDFFVGGETRTAKYRTEINEMGEVPRARPWRAEALRQIPPRGRR
jgi:glutathione S-transferase